MASMAAGMERLARELGVRFHFDSAVEEILVEDGKAVGIRSAATGTERADHVLCCADFPNAMRTLVKDPKARGPYTPRKIASMDYSCSCLLFYLGLDMDLKGRLPVHNLLFSDDFEGNIRDIFEGRFPTDASLYVYAASTLDPSLAPAGKDGLYILCPVSDLKTGTVDWTDPMVLEDVRARIFRRVADIPALRDFADHVVFERMVTPLHFRDALGSEYGATFGLRPTLLQSNYFRPRNRSRTCRGLYFAGASNHPGAGVPIVLYSAKLAVGEIVRDDRAEKGRGA
jgi:phytoene desaturase